MLSIEVLPPIKSKTRYEFRCIVKGNELTFDEFKKRATSVVRGYGSLSRSVLRFGYTATNFEINHSEIWDSIYPLHFLTRNGGPLFNTKHEKAEIHFQYPVLEKVKQFYVERAVNLDLCIDIEGPTYDRRFDIPTDGTALSFGGGKDSRLVLGVLAETGHDPGIYYSGKKKTFRQFVSDITGANTATPFLMGGLSNHVMPALMSRSEIFFFGGNLAETHLQRPWHNYYDWSNPRPLQHFSSLMESLGFHTDHQSPVSVLPPNLIQKILFDRYPQLFKYQYSVRKNSADEKNLHISLCKMYHGIEFGDHCSRFLFKKLLKDFVDSQTKSPDPFGYRRYREVFNREMRCIIYKMHEHELFNEVRDLIPDEWDDDWIDYIHTYVYPDINPAFLQIYKEYAPDIADGHADPHGYRVPV